MEICMKDTLRRLRKEKNVTQEELAARLGISAQSVSKWERGEGFPDITLLPNIALFFGVTVDELLNVSQARIEEKIKAYEEEHMRYARSGDMDKMVALWEKAYAEFPNDCRVMSHLMTAIEAKGRLPMPEEDAKRIIMLGERILAESNDTKLRVMAIDNICLTYNFMGDTENALRYADMGGNIHFTKAYLRSLVLPGEEGVKEAQEFIVTLLNLASTAAVWIRSKVELSPEEDITICEFSINLLKLLFSDGNVGIFANDLSWWYSLLAIIYAGEKNADKTYESLEECAKYSVMEANLREMSYTAPLVNRLKFEPQKHTKNYKGNACNLQLRDLERDCFDFIREDERFKKIVRTLEEHAEPITE